MSMKFNIISALGFIGIGFSLFAAPAFASPLVISDLSNSNSSSIKFVILSLRGFFGIDLELHCNN
jgi:hypothetical protein